MHDGFITTLVFVTYLAAMLGIGILAYRRTRDLADYVLGGRRLGSLTTALSAGASDMSGWLLLGLPGYAYLAGLEAGWIALGLLIGTYLNWRVVAVRLRQATAAAHDALTLPTYLERRFNDGSGGLRVIAALFILLFFTFYTSSGLVAGGKLFHTVFGLPYVWAVAVGAGAIIVYTFLGGFLAVSWTDVVQGLLMCGALIVVPLAAVSHAGGWLATWEAVRAVDPALLDLWRGTGGAPLGVVAIASLLGWGLGYFGQPHILARFMAIRSVGDVPRARRIAMGWVALSLAGALVVGFAGIVVVQPRLAGGASETVFIELVHLLFHPVLAGIWLAAILAAVMSTADSQLLVASSTLTEDLYRAITRRDAHAAELVWVGRAAVITIALAAFVLALEPDRQVLNLVAYAWAGFGAAFGPTILLSLYWPRMTRNGALAGIVTGGVSVIVWKQLAGGVFDLYEIIPGFVLSLAAIAVVSLFDRAPLRAAT